RAHMPVFVDIVLGVVRVYSKGAHTYGIPHRVFKSDHMLRHHIIADHSAGFSNVQLGSPVAAFDKFIEWQSPRLVECPNVLWNSQVILNSPDITLLIEAM